MIAPLGGLHGGVTVPTDVVKRDWYVTRSGTCLQRACDEERINTVFPCLHGFSELRLETEKTQEMQFAFLNLAAALICYRLL
jgi:hypothetical protein